MGNIRPFRKRTGGRHSVTGLLPAWQSYALWIFIGLAGVAVVLNGGGPHLKLPEIGIDTSVTQSFAMCGGSRRDNCVIDGDTFRFDGEKIRIADIDAPETHPSRCAEEARLGTAATNRLQELLNEGPFRMRTQGRDEDQYGRKLRVVTRDGRSLGTVLVREGLAREWIGHREPWCEGA